MIDNVIKYIFFYILIISNATPFTHGSDPGSFTNSSAGATGSSGGDFGPFADTGRSIYATDPYREPPELYANPGPPGPDFGAHVSQNFNNHIMCAGLISVKEKK